MTSYRPSLSRRRALAGLTGGGLSLALMTASRATTQEATPEFRSFLRIGHPLLGAWQLHLTEVLGDPPTIAIFSEDGTYLEYNKSVRFGVGIGLWLVTSDRSGEVVVNFQRLDRGDDAWPAGTMFASDYVPEPHRFVPGVVSMRLSFELRGSDNTVAVTGTMEIRDANETIIAGPFPTAPVSGTRLVEAPG